VPCPFPPDLTIACVAPRCYAPPGGRPYRLESSEDAVLQCFLDGVPLSLRELVRRSGVPHAHVVLRRLEGKYGGAFAPAIFRPGKRGNGGYLVALRDAVHKQDSSAQ
jgi:hypothetical protein